MRLRLTIIRHGLPAARILWTVAPATSQSAVPTSTVASTRAPNVAYGNEGCTIAQLLEDVNEVVPLETAIAGGTGTLGENDEFGGQWGLEDYAVEVDGFECLHFMHVDGLLRDGDEVVIRSLGIGDLRARRLSGRIQVSTDGRRLIDGVPFGRHFLQRSHSSRPAIRIPPRKRRRTTTSSGWTVNLQGEDDIAPRIAAPYDNRLALYDEASVQSSEQGTVIRHPVNLFDDLGDSESDMDYSEGAEEDLAEELEQLREETEDNISVENITIRGAAGRKSRMAHREHDPMPSSSPARPLIMSTLSTPRTIIGRGTEKEATPKSSKSVRFEADEPFSILSKLSAHDVDSESDEQSMSDSNSAVSEDSSDDSSEGSDDEDFVSLESEAESEAESESESESESDSDSSSTSEEEESESEPESEVEKDKPIDVFTPPGHGSLKTRNSNRRKKLRTKLQKLKELGELAPEANFDDLKKWESKHGKRPLTEVMDIEDLLDSRAKEQSEIELKRQQLLRDLASGGIDVDGCSEKENIPPQDTNGKQNEVEKSPAVSKAPAEEEAQLATKVVEDGEKASPGAIKRRKLDISSTQRLLFGSLGVRTPKSKKDEEALRLKLAGPRDKYLPKTTETVPAEKAVEDELIDENWESKIILTATECVFDDIKLIAPAFPFQQRWDADASWEIRQRRNNNKNKKKRKQRDWQEDAYTSLYDDAWENADEGVTLNYDDAPLTTQKEDHPGNVNGDGEEDLPTLPSDPNSLPSLTESEATAGAIIAFKQLDMSKATNWQPQVSEYKVAKVDEVLDSGSLNLVLAKRDREIRQAAVVDEDGVRQYSGFEMPKDDEDEDEGVEDDGFRNLLFIDLLEPKLLRSASRQEEKNGELENGNHDESRLELSSLPPPVPVSAGGSNNASAETSVEADDNELPPPPPPAPVAVSSQTRRDITHMIHDAGFRSAIDSDLGLSMSIMEKVAPRDSDNGAESEAAKSSSDSPSSSDHEISSSPPEALLDGQTQHDSFDHDAAGKIGGDEDAGGSLEVAAIDDGFDFPMDGGDDDFYNAGGEEDGNNSDDGVSLPNNNNGENEPTTENDTGIVEEETATSYHPLSSSQPSQAAENSQSVPQGKENNNTTTAESETGDQTTQDVESEKQRVGEEKSFLSTTLRGDADESRLQDCFVTASGDISSDEYSDANSVVSNPFYERDRIAKENEAAAARKKTKITSTNNSSPSRGYAHNSQSEKSPTRHTKQSVEGKGKEKEKEDQQVSPLNQEEEENNNGNVSDSSFNIDDLPSVEVLWASTRSSRPFPPIKIEGPKQSSSGGDHSHHNDNDRHKDKDRDNENGKSTAACSLSPPWTGTKDSSSPAFEPMFSTKRKTAAAAKKQPNNVPPKSPVAVLEIESQETTYSANISDDQNLDSRLDDDDNTNSIINNQQEYQPQNEVEANRAPPPMTIDLTLSSPLVSPVDEGSDEDFARSPGLPRGAGWVKKNVPPTQRQTRRQTRSSTGGGEEIILSSSPVRPTQRRKRTVRDL